MDNEQFNEFIRQLKEYIKNEHEKIESDKKAAVTDAHIKHVLEQDKFWQCIAEELEKRTCGSRLGGKYATDLAKRMFTTLPNDQLQTLIGDAIKRLENQQNADNQTCI